jgi:probable rRNA maturation factor
MTEITNLTNEKIDKKILVKVAEKATKILGGKGLEDISLVLVCDARMRNLNKKYRGKNYITDVLSFEGLNEIFICFPQAKRQAKLLKIPLNRELTRLFAHGIVHLKGYNHERSKREAARMLALENKILKNL